ncbi:MAG: HAMP domain-containing histidine kinase [candidate division Zixibacteria bacterium]|nr:HAMP domain-containing histidine kinase [candidate division Zixibacteria bacterium]
MTPALRRKSLFWTFAGSFLAVLLIAAIIQGIIVITILRPLSARLAESRANLLAEQAAERVSWALGDSALTDVGSVLREFGRENRGVAVFYRSKDGHVVSDRQMPPGADDRFHARWDSMSAQRMEEFAQRSPQGPDRDRRRVVVEQPVVVGTDTAGHVMVVAFNRAGGGFREPAPGSGLLLLLPVAILVAGIAGLIMFRAVVRRLRALENLAREVSGGNLGARVSDPSSDEIGRLALSLNSMTASLAEARERILASDSQRRQLLADITHELATPLTSIRGYAETLLQPSMPITEAERDTYLSDILQESERMDLLINDLLELTRLEAGAISLAKERIDWVALARNMVARFQSKFRDAALTLTFADSDTEAWIEADGRRLEQVIENLLLNAIRYVPQGGHVSIAVVRDAAPGPESWQMIVADDGPGFEAQDLPHVFDRFYRASTARSSSGSGLGLAIVQEIVRRHGGQVRAENAEPHGARIVVDLPAASVQ